MDIVCMCIIHIYMCVSLSLCRDKQPNKVNAEMKQ